MTKQVAMVIGVVFILIGLLGFIPGVTHDSMLFGLFKVDALHNVVHLLSGAVLLYASMAGASQAKTGLQVIGVVYALVAILGFFVGDGKVLGFLVNNANDTYLHLVLALVILYFGFMGKDEAAA